MTGEAFPAALRRIRSERGLSLASLGALVNYSRQYIWDLEHGRRRPPPDAVEALDRALAADGYLAYLGATEATDPVAVPVPLAGHRWCRTDAEALANALVVEEPTPDNALTLAHEWLVTDPPQAFELKAGRHVGLDLVERMEQRVHQIRLIDDHVGGLDTYAMVAAELGATADLLREASFTEDVGRRLLAVVAELCQIAGWVAADAGRHGEARRLYLAGGRAAHGAGDRPGAASNLSSLAYQLANVGDPREAVLLARSAYRGAADAASAATRALLLERVAWAEARADDPDGAGRALDLVDDAFDERQPDTDPPWVYWLNRDEIDVMQGRVWTQLRRPLRAVPVLDRALAQYDPQETPRETALYLTWLAEALVQGHEIDRAAETSLRALRLARQAHSARATARVAELHQLLAPYAGGAAVDGFLEECQEG